MRIFGLFFILLFSAESDVRALYLKSFDDSDKADKLVNTCKTKLNIPFYRAYYGSGLGMQAKHSWNPVTKLSKAKEAAQQLNLAVSYAASDFEVRFLRFSYEAKVPSIVGITKHTSDDKKWLLAHLDKKHPMWSTIKKFLSDCNLLTEKEKKDL
jgi:hypothetical protein